MNYAIGLGSAAQPRKFVTVDKATNGWIVTVDVSLRAPEHTLEQAQEAAQKAAHRHRERLAGEIKQQVAGMAVMGEAIGQINAASVQEIDEEIEPWKKNAHGRKKKPRAEDLIKRADDMARKIVESMPLPEPHACGHPLGFVDPIQVHVFREDAEVLAFLATLFSGEAL